MDLEIVAQIGLSPDTLSLLTPMPITQQKEFPDVIGGKSKENSQCSCEDETSIFIQSYHSGSC